MKQILVVLMVWSSAALADPAPDEVARAHYVSAQAYYKQGRTADALREFQEAYRISPRPAFHYNIAICHEKLGDTQRAVDAYERYLSEEPTAEDHAAVQDHVAQLKLRLVPPAPPAPDVVEEVAPPVERRPPVWKRGWFWGVVAGGAAVVIGVVVIGAVVGSSGDSINTLPGVTLR